MRLFLVRHGRTRSNVGGLLDTAFPGAPLDDVGRRQADALPARLGAAPVDAVFASDIHRAQQTATPLADALGVRLGVLPGLREIPAGDQEMSASWGPYIDVLRAWGAGHLDTKRPGGEDANEFFGRYDGAIEQIAGSGAACAVAVSHGAAMRVWLGSRVAGLDPEEVARRELGNTAIIELEGTAGAWRFVAWDPGVTDDTPNNAPEDMPPLD